MIPWWWSFLLAGVGVAGLYCTTREGGLRWAGYGVGLGVQFLWVAYALTTGQLGFLVSAFAYGSVNCIGLWRWWSGRGEASEPKRWTLSEIEELRDRLNGDRAEIVDGAPWVYGRDFTMGDRLPEDGPQSSPEAVAEIIDSWGEGRADWAASVGHGGGRVPQAPVYCQECGLQCKTEWTLVSEYGLSGVFHSDCLAKARTRITEQGLKRWPR